VLVADADASRLFEATLEAQPRLGAKAVSNWITGEYLRLRNAAPSEARPTADPAQLAELIRLVTDGEISRANGKDVFEAHLASGERVDAIVSARGLRQISDVDALGTIVDEVIAANPAAAADVRAGKAQAIGFLVGAVMKQTRGQANAAVVQAALRERLAADGAGEGS
jgi:aspartyl-tRNA(Asn)/glutamyl-tRNA(Gln) amidotransferase subunit B